MTIVWILTAAAYGIAVAALITVLLIKIRRDS